MLMIVPLNKIMTHTDNELIAPVEGESLQTRLLLLADVNLQT